MALREPNVPNPRPQNSRAVAIWLLACATLIFAMIVLGGVTRLTRSGLSIVEWKPITGTIPPLTAHQWQAEFDKYRGTPEFQKVNTDMDLAGFQSIYWVEYSHRLLGRMIGFAFLIPFIYFLVRRRIDRALAPKLITLFVLGGLQGALGWYMVASGLVDNPHVSPHRLTAHLGLAAILYGYIWWVALGLLYPAAVTPATARGVRRFAWAVTGLVFVTILAGGFVAGTRAGFAFNTFPLMNGKFVPESAYALQPWWVDVFENVATVQFHHRLLAYSLLVVVPLLWLAVRRQRLTGRVRAVSHGLLAALLLQVGLGIATLLLVVPIPLAAAHQAGAMLVFTMALSLVHALRGR
ncbi:MAG: COX15/CtaA family protein [Gammaproteobacteria bacterium]|nr:COX15/CtaA family protein [Gammaproteobacteria bacterium]